MQVNNQKGEECGMHIIAGYSWCAEKYPCKMHGKWKEIKTTMTTTSSTEPTTKEGEEVFFQDKRYILQNMTFKDWEKDVRQSTLEEVIEEVEGMKNGRGTMIIDGIDYISFEYLLTSLKNKIKR